MTINFAIPGRIGGKGRPRFVRATGRTYTPEKTRSTEALVRTIASDAMKGDAPLEGAVALKVNVWITPPQSWSKKKRAAADYVTGKPDCDNVLKLIGDACNGIVWRDDSQIAEASISRRYMASGQECVIVNVHDLTARPFVPVTAIEQREARA